MNKYHKIQTLYKRDPATNMRTLLEGEFSLPELEYLAGSKWVFTEKVDGTNIRVHWDGKGKVQVGGRTDDAQIHAHLLNPINEMFNVDKLAFLYPDAEMTFYGEGYGHKVQKVGKLYLPDSCSFILFDVFIGGFWLERDNVHDIAEKMGLDSVPVIGRGTLYDAVEMTREGFKSQLGDLIAEGLIMRPLVELFSRKGDRIISKIKHKDFALVKSKAA